MMITLNDAEREVRTRMSESNEQWVNGGHCSKCRKQNYCGSKCNEYYRRNGEEIKGFLNDYFASKYGGSSIVSELMGDAVESAVDSRKWG